MRSFVRSLLASAPLALSACHSAPATTAAATAASTTSVGGSSANGAPGHFGQPLSGAPAIPVATLLAAPAAYDGKTVTVDGAVRAACTRKGCWMELAPGTVRGPQGCRVTFKDYGFFVPTDSAGATARVEGVVSVTTIAPAEVAHLEGEGASFAAKEQDGSAREVRLVATGVDLHR